ncbi:hypothetical protein QN362_16580 [Actimicrobium sp. CCC2.4]|uniref:hypothetical protein n=1 Tax=Actimicrobium sp. CCC2.4 TaxID=3048606 RepID=UPI002AC8AC43|nr:hypothetical protein [Actimicrobium sp. CCC2.4]MEB0136953.1 hypothetical protein [Actimicrobium sp. CCC2.4]WPX32727.1 hypothetical protein RHM62_02430 [Actimicrobium sp. CCC2.4]
MLQISLKTMLAVLGAAVLSVPVGAQHVSSGLLPSSLSVISDTALSNATGHVGFNSSAGQGNAQSNATALGFGGSGVISGADLVSDHQGAVAVNGVRGNEDVVIRGDAFRAARGVISVNQSSGSGNAQTNMVLLGISGISEIAIDQLVQVSAVAPADSAGPEARPAVRRAEIADSAFAGSRGIVQVNQSAGLGNRTANVFALNVSSVVP